MIVYFSFFQEEFQQAARNGKTVTREMDDIAYPSFEICHRYSEATDPYGA